MFLLNLRSKFGRDLNFFLFGTLFLCVESTHCGDGEVELQYTISSSGRMF